MSVHIAVRQVLRWTLRSATCSVSKPVVLCGYHVRKTFLTTRGVRCSELNQTSDAFRIQPSRAESSPSRAESSPSRAESSPSRAESSPSRAESSPSRAESSPSRAESSPSRELCPRSVLDMGFTHTQAEQVCEAVTRCPGGLAGGDAVSTLTALFVLGLNPSSVVKVVEKCPELLCVKGAQLQQRIDNLRKLGLMEGGLQRVVSHYPRILTMPPKRVNVVVRFLRERCLFTSQQVTDILRDSPAVVQEDLGRLEYQFQYAYFRMGVKQAEQVKARLLRVGLEDLRCRHAFLERRGLFQTPDKKGQTLILNPSVSSVLDASEDTYLSDVAMATQEEYEVFRRLMAREWQEEDQQRRRTEPGSDDDDEEEEEEEGGKAGYQKRRKR